MKFPRLFPVFALALVLVSPAGSAAETSSKIDPKALESLKRMSDSLAAAPAFTYRSRSVIEVPAGTGQFLTLFSAAKVALRRPDGLRAELSGEAPAFQFYYDGKTVTAFAPATKVYSKSPAPATVDAMLPDLEAETGIRFVTAPLFYSNPYSIFTRGLLSGIVVGPVMVDGELCEHLAFRSPGVNWEIWIEAGGNGLPRRLAVTFTDRPNFPRTIVEFSNWNLRPWLTAGSFAFRPPAGAREIPFGSVLKSAGRR